MATALTREELQEQQRRLTVYQDRYDQALMPWGRRAPEPTLTESPGRYRRRVLSHAQLVPSELVLELSLARSPVRVRLSDQAATSSG